MKKKKPEVKRFIITLDREYVETVIPKIEKFFHKKDMGELLSLAFGILVLHAEIIEKGNRLVEVDGNGNPIAYVSFSEVEKEIFQKNNKLSIFIDKLSEE